MNRVVLENKIKSCHCEGFVRSNLLVKRLLHPTKNVGFVMTENQKAIIIREGNNG